MNTKERMEGLIREGMEVRDMLGNKAIIKCYDYNSIYVRYGKDTTGRKINEYTWDEFTTLFGESIEEAI